MPVNLLQHVSDTNTVLLFSFIGGFVDSAGYLKLGGIFTSSITGNLVVACTSVAALKGVVCRSLCSIAFAFGAFLVNFLVTFLKLGFKINEAYITTYMVALEAISLAVVTIVGSIFNRDVDNAPSIDSFYIVLMACLMGFAMGVQNGAIREGFTNFPATTVMTSTLVNVSAMASATFLLFLELNQITHLHGNEQNEQVPKTPVTPQQDHNHEVIAGRTTENNLKPTSSPSTVMKKYLEARDKLITLLRPLISFLVGAIIGAITMYHINFRSIIIPTFLTAFISIEIFIKIHSPPPPAANTQNSTV